MTNTLDIATETLRRLQKQAELAGCSADELLRRWLDASEEPAHFPHFQEQLLNAVGEAVIATDLQGSIIYWNRAAETLYGWTAEEALGRCILDTTPSEVSRARAEQIIRELGKGQQWAGEIEVQRKDGSTFMALVRDHPIVDDSGQMIGVVGTALDITRLKHNEAMTQENERLKARFQKEQEQNALVQQTIYALSHDLRTPLTVIATAKDILSRYFDHLTHSKRQEKLDSIGRQLQFVLEVLDDTVAVVQSNLNQLELKPAPVNLAALCKISVEEIGTMTEASDRLHFVNPGGVETVLIDEILVSRILLNLLTNAIKYSPDDSPVRLELHRRGDWVVLRVVDRGIGIQPEDLPHIFEPFYRAKNLTQISGTGLGLSIVKDCAERHQGRITVESKPGKGSVFTVELPAPAVR